MITGIPHISSRLAAIRGCIMYVSYKTAVIRRPNVVDCRAPLVYVIVAGGLRDVSEAPIPMGRSFFTVLPIVAKIENRTKIIPWKRKKLGILPEIRLNYFTLLKLIFRP